MERLASDRTGMARMLGLGAAVVPIVFAVLVTVAGTAYDGYSHASQAISELGGVEASTPAIQNLNFAVSGVLIIGLAAGLWLVVRASGRATIAPWLIGYFGVVIGLAQPLLPCDAGCEFESATGVAHNLTGLSSFVSIGVGMLLLSRWARGVSEWAPLAGFLRIVGIAILVSLIAWIGVAKAAGVEELNGVLQRVMAGAMLTAVGVTGVWMARHPEPGV